MRPWIDEYHKFDLKEDEDSSHGLGKSKIVQIWKKTKGIKF